MLIKPSCGRQGDGWSPRAEDAISHGCIPVLIMDDVDPVFASVLDWPSFSIRIAEVLLLLLLLLYTGHTGHKTNNNYTFPV